MLKDRNFAIATFTMFMLGFVLYGTTVLLPLLLQTLMGYTALLSGLVLSPGSLLVLIALPIVGRLTQVVEARWLVAIGLAITGFSLLHMAHFNLEIDFRTAVMAWTYSRLGMAFLFTPINVMAFYFIPKERMNNATGIINLARNIGGSVGIANVTTLLARRAQVHQSTLVSHLTPLDPAYTASLSGASRFLMSQGFKPRAGAKPGAWADLWQPDPPVQHAGLYRQFLATRPHLPRHDPVHVSHEESQTPRSLRRACALTIRVAQAPLSGPFSRDCGIRAGSAALPPRVTGHRLPILSYQSSVFS